MVSNNEQRKVDLAEPDATRRPHPAASELTEQNFRRSPGEQRENYAARKTVGDAKPISQAQRKVGNRLAAYTLLILGLAIVVTMVLMGSWNWGLFFLGLAIIFCYMLLISAPFWLASSTKTAQDEAAKDAVKQNPGVRDRAPEAHQQQTRPRP